MPGEVARDEPVLDVERNYNIEVHNVILYTITDIIHCRFAASAVLCSDFACMDLRNFPEIRDKGLPKTALEELSKCLAKFDERATIPTLQAELTSRANQLETLKIAPLSGYKVRRVTELSEEGVHTEDPEECLELENIRCSSCKNFPICCYHILYHFNLLTDAYHIIGIAYKFLLTLSVTQVAGERTFSTLKFVKNRLRTYMSQHRLEAFLLMSTEKEILMELDSDGIIDKLAESSALMRRMLTF